LYAGIIKDDGIGNDFNIHIKEKENTDKQFLKKKRKGKNFEYYLNDKVEKNEFEDEEDCEFQNGSDMDKSVISSFSVLNDEIIFGKDHLDSINENEK